jgi:hypothetical protein
VILGLQGRSSVEKVPVGAAISLSSLLRLVCLRPFFSLVDYDLRFSRLWLSDPFLLGAFPTLSFLLLSVSPREQKIIKTFVHTT